METPESSPNESEYGSFLFYHHHSGQQQPGAGQPAPFSSTGNLPTPPNISPHEVPLHQSSPAAAAAAAAAASSYSLISQPSPLAAVVPPQESPSGGEQQQHHPNYEHYDHQLHQEYLNSSRKFYLQGKPNYHVISYSI